MTVYAKCPEGDWDYLTAGKLYPVHNEHSGGFSLVDNEGDEISCLWNNCPHIDGYNWERVECAVDWTKPIEIERNGEVFEASLTGEEDRRYVKVEEGDGRTWWAEKSNGEVIPCGFFVRNRVEEPKPLAIENSPTLRDQFAMAALAAAYSNDVPRDTARWVYEVADAMLEARKVNNEAA